jgi:tRNA(Ile)-lysidine synthase
LPAGSQVLVAVSGGADSTALLASLASVAGEFGLALTAAHLHHGLRGADADADLEHVRALCARLGVPLLAARWDCRARMRREGLSGEDGLRRLRRRYLLAAAKRAGAAAIATAHTADDQLETVLMRLARGTGLAGLGGMWPRQGRWLKPLLRATRLDAELDLAGARIAWREDASNAERTWLRNRVRLDVVPALLAAVSGSREPSPAARAALARRVAATAADVRAGARVVARLAALALARRSGPDGTSIDVRGWAALPIAVRHSVLARLWKAAAPRSSGLPRAHRDALDALLAGGRRRAELAMPGGGRAALSTGRLRLTAAAPKASPGPREPGPKVRAPAGRKARASNGPADARLRPTAARRARSGRARSHARAGIANRRRAASTTVSR